MISPPKIMLIDVCGKRKSCFPLVENGGIGFGHVGIVS